MSVRRSSSRVINLRGACKHVVLDRFMEGKVLQDWWITSSVSRRGGLRCEKVEEKWKHAVLFIGAKQSRALLQLTYPWGCNSGSSGRLQLPLLSNMSVLLPPQTRAPGPCHPGKKSRRKRKHSTSTIHHRHSQWLNCLKIFMDKNNKNLLQFHGFAYIKCSQLRVCQLDVIRPIFLLL